MLHPSSPKHKDKPNAENRIDYSGELFQMPDPIFVFLLQGFIFVKLIECLPLLLLINIDKLNPSEIQLYVRLFDFDVIKLTC